MVTYCKTSLRNLFTYHKPDGSQAKRYDKIRQAAYKFALVIDEHCPNSPEKAEAITDLRRSVMMANASIACNETPED